MKHNTIVLQNNFSLVTVNVLICGFIYAAISCFQYYYPVAYSYFVSEDGWAESHTFVFYLMACFLMLGVMTIDRTTRRSGYVLFCMGLFFIAMEEVSWGQRIIGVHTPFFIAEYNRQAELNIHNLSFFPKEHLFYYAILIWAVLLPEMSRKFSRVKCLFNNMGVPLVSCAVCPYFVFGVILFNFNVAIYQKEIGEMIMGFAFVLFTGEIFCNVLKDVQKNIVARNQFIAGGILISSAVTYGLMAVGPSNIYHQRYAFHVIASESYPKWGMYAQADKVFKHIIDHDELKYEDSLFRYGIFLEGINRRDAGEIFLAALQEVQARARLTPDKSTPNLLAARIYRKLNRDDLAETELNEVLRKEQDRFSKIQLGWEKAAALTSIGEMYMEMKNFSSAREYFQKALAYTMDGSTKLKVHKLLKQTYLDAKK